MVIAVSLRTIPIAGALTKAFLSLQADVLTQNLSSLSEIANETCFKISNIKYNSQED